MTKHNPDTCPLCAGSGEVTIIPAGEPDSAAGTYGCPLCIAAERDEAEEQRIRALVQWHTSEARRLRSKLPAGDLDSLRLGWTTLGRVKQLLPDLLTSDEQGFRDNAQIIEALVNIVEHGVPPSGSKP